MKVECELYDRGKHYGMIALWWRRHGAEAMPAVVLGFGVIVKIDDVPRAAVFGYLDQFSGAMGMIEFAVTNPGNKPKQSVLALKTAVECATELLIKRGAVCVMSFFENAGLNRLVGSLKFFENERNITSMIYLKENR